MKPIRVEIRRLGAITDSKVELSPVMFFSGDSGLGKSYLALLCHYFFDILLDRNRLSKFFDESDAYQFNKLRHSFKGEKGEIFKIATRDLEEWLREDVIGYMRYMLQVEDVQCDVNVILPPEIDLSYSYDLDISGLNNEEDTYFILKLSDLQYRVKDMDIVAEESPFSVLTRHYMMSILLNNYLGLQETVILPPSRGAFFTEKIEPITGIFKRFSSKMESLKRISEHQAPISKEFVSKFEEIISGKISYRDNQYFYESNRISLPVSGAASSVKEIAPLSLIIKKFEMAKTAVLFEEPEAHLHPCMQRKMADLLSMLITHGAYMQITTHSDYILRRLNELIAIDKLRGEYSSEKFEEVCRELGIPPALALDTSRISAYYLERRDDGTSRVERQTLEQGHLSYQSFFKAIEDELRLTSRLQDLMDTIKERD